MHVVASISSYDGDHPPGDTPTPSLRLPEADGALRQQPVVETTQTQMQMQMHGSRCKRTMGDRFAPFPFPSPSCSFFNFFVALVGLSRPFPSFPSGFAVNSIVINLFFSTVAFLG